MLFVCGSQAVFKHQLGRLDTTASPKTGNPINVTPHHQFLISINAVKCDSLLSHFKRAKHKMTSRPPRYLKNNPTALLHVPDPKRELQLCLTELQTSYPPKKSYVRDECCGIYNGPTSIAYLFLHLSRSYQDLVIADRKPLNWCIKYLNGSRPTGTVDAGHCGVANETLAHLAVCAAASRDVAIVRRFVSVLEKARIMKPTSGGSCEWLYGRAGTLYLLRLIRSFVPDADHLVDPVIKDVCKRILEIGKEVEWRWKWHGKAYLGAAHGAIGIVMQVTFSLSGDDSRESKEMSSKMEKVLERLLALQRKDGNWAPRIDSSADRDELLQFCHGAPGFTISLTDLLSRGFFPSLREKMEEAIKKARKATWEKGLLVKEPCLCHGISGNGLALEGEQREHFLTYTTVEMVKNGQGAGLHERVFGTSSNPWGLYGGLAGRAWGFLELVREKNERGSRSRGLIGYSDV